MGDSTKHLAKKCVKNAGPCLALCLAGAMMTGGVLDLVFWVLDPFGWKNEG